MKFLFRQSSCVAVGTFNIYIVQPKLLCEMGVLEDRPRPIVVAGDLAQPGIRFDADDSKWTVRPDRLAVESTAAHVDCGGFVGSTLAALRWTPIMAIGINAVYRSENDEAELISKLKLPHCEIASQRGIYLAVPGPKRVDHLNIHVVKNEDKLELTLNLHTDFASKKCKQLELNEQVRDLCKSSMELRNSAVDTARQLIGVEFGYDQ